ncbi:MAG TPA: bifunctional ADP-dependent NAD(P)H-hydrate dehydratase/NAD(P)H-hydrate epimerase, partial [Oribacterium sp.]|nr:bifunctional ADP-dependent NAD(P)H-hydrate dehydratase/NAD(P)H-hydrate epimerase [Oribacterium sp.]
MERIMSDEMSAGKSSAAKTLTLEEIKSFIPARDPESNKGSYGKLFVIAGSSGMSGAAFFAALSAYRAGTGLVKLFTHSDNRIILQTQLPEAILLDYSEEKDALQKLQMSMHWAHDILIGPGIGTDTLSCAILKQALQLLLSE